jgi:hypothetical protein
MSRTWLTPLLIAFVAAVPSLAFAGDRVSPPPSRGLVLPALYVSFAALNAYDAVSTTDALKHGAVEANPLLGGIAGRQAALWAVKGGVTAASIVAAENLWRQGHKGHAIILMVATNSILTVASAHNASVLRGLK